eukprot:TRINITY_DN38287_c0_g1_i1.p3 TRINITY_DN38287_c0_g1~~TRINITY_DN38287_c0_g1_i1.p3  ORF type:complete len:111 (-),score=24.75 TRINITY_DN38287_c0_g1_i1:59-391(-)
MDLQRICSAVMPLTLEGDGDHVGPTHEVTDVADRLLHTDRGSLERAFRKYDLNGSGQLDMVELQALSGTLGMSMDQLETMYRTLDRDCLLYTSDAADEEDSVDLGGRRIN